MPHAEGKREQFAAMFAAGMPIDEIAQSLRMSHHTAREWIDQDGLHREPLKPPSIGKTLPGKVIQFIADHYRKPDWSASKIARHLGLTRNTVIGRANRMGLSTVSGPRSTPIKMHNLPPAPPRSSCQWIDGDVTRAGDFGYCGDPVSTGSYCQEHAKLAYVRCRTASEANAHIAAQLGGMLKMIEKQAREMKL